jgi:hypothetical protein
LNDPLQGFLIDPNETEMKHFYHENFEYFLKLFRRILSKTPLDTPLKHCLSAQKESIPSSSSNEAVQNELAVMKAFVNLLNVAAVKRILIQRISASSLRLCIPPTMKLLDSHLVSNKLLGVQAVSLVVSKVDAKSSLKTMGITELFIDVFTHLH